MWITNFLILTFINQVCTKSMADATKSRKYIFATVFDSILLTGNIQEVKNNQIIQWSFIDRLHKSLMLFHSVGVDSPSLSPYYQHRCTYYATNGSLELRRLEITDSGIYQLSVERYYSESPDKLFIHSVFLDVEEALSTPLIIQEPIYVANNVQLTCVAKKGNPKKLLWLKGNKPITNSSRYTLGDKNSTLSINGPRKGHCGFYTCIAVDSISERNISHFLIIDGTQFLHKRILVTSVIALISTLMSLGGTTFIIFALEKYKAQKYQTRLTIAFIVVKMKSYICLLISSILCILDTEFFAAYRIISGFVICLLLGMTGYITFLYIHPYGEEIGSFLLHKRERNILLGSGIFNVIISPLPIYEASANVKICTHPYGDVAVTTVSTVMIYLSIVGLCFIFAIKNMQTWNLTKRTSRLWSR